MVRCGKCNKNATVKVNQLGNLCNNCYSNIIEKRVRRYIRINDFFQKDDKVVVLGDLSYFFIKKILKDLPLDLKMVNNPKKIFDFSQDTKIVIDFTMDDEIDSFLSYLFGGSEHKKTRYIKVLRLITDEEALIYSRLHKINFKLNRKKKYTKRFIDNLEKDYPEIKYGTSKSISQLEKLIN